jgi:hypothetical protein
LANIHSSNKNKGGGSGDDKSNASHGNTNQKFHIKECNLCALWNLCAKGTHWTFECTRFNKDGSHKERARPYSKAGGGGGKPCYNNLLGKDLHEQMKKIKKLTKKYKSQNKGSKRGRGHDASDIQLLTIL